jgi:Flp pilus assembly pilin Flp
MNRLQNVANEKSLSSERPMKTYFCNLIQSLLIEEAGNAATEYAIMVALILMLCIAGVLSTGDFQKQIWENSAVKVESIVPGP